MYCWLSCHAADHQTLNKSQGHLNETSCDTFCHSSKQIDIDISPKNIDLCIKQAATYHPGAISQSKSNPQVLHLSKGHPNGTSCESFEQIDINKHPKNIDWYTKHAIICLPCARSHNESDCQVLKKIRGTSLWDVLQHILQDFLTTWHQYISQKHWFIYKTDYYLSPMCYITQKVIAMSWKKSEGHPYETSHDIFCNSS